MGKGTKLSDKKVQKSRARRKTITDSLILNLIKVAKKKGRDSKTIQTYWNTYHCQRRVYGFDGKLHGKYCKNRICTICLGIRKAETIRKYYPVLSKWPDCQFLTLTIKSIPAKELARYTKGMNKIMVQIIAKYRRRHLRGRDVQLKGVRSFECNFNPKTRKYNPHFHLLLETEGMANKLRNEWLKVFPKKHVNPLAQKIRKVDNLEHDLVEVIKYGSKIFTDSDLTRKSRKMISPFVYVSALDNILNAFSGHRLFQNFGFKLPPDSKFYPEKNIQLTNQYDEWVYKSVLRDWINLSTGEMLSGYEPTMELMDILKYKIDLEIE